MRLIVPSIAGLSLFASLALAQPVTAPASPQNPPLKSPNQNNAAMAVAGANSFTQSEAIKQIEARGYTNVSGLTKDQNGIWRGTAMKDGKSGPISVDYQGNVN
jgi:hypothetical protein